MRSKPQERGQALVIIALAVVGLFGFSALAIDGSRVFSDRRNAQNAADTSALSAALAKVRQEPYVPAGYDRAVSNGYANDMDSQVEVHLCTDAGISPACQGIPLPPANPTKEELDRANPANYIQVKITSTIPATFARIVGRQQFTNIVTAIAYAGPVAFLPVLDGHALAALKETGDATLAGNGVVHLEVHGSGVFNNSANNCGTQIAGASGSYSVDPGQYFNFVSGTYCSGAGNNQLNPVQASSPVPYPPNFNIQAPNISCSGNGHRTQTDGTTWTYTPGNYASGDTLNWAGNVILQPGNYCFGNSFKINGPVHTIANDVNIRLSGGEMSLNGGAVLTCNDMLVHVVNGASGVRFNGTSEVHCNDVTFFVSTGTVNWSGNAIVRMFAPKGGDYKGLLIYMPYPNNAGLTIQGNSNNELTGSILAAASDILIAGNSGTNGLHTQIIGYTVTLEGHSNTVINYNPDEQWAPPDPSILALTK